MKPFNCWRPALSFSLVASIHWFTQSYKCNNNNAEITPFIPVLAGQNLHMSQTPSHQRQNTWPTNCTLKNAHASVFFYTSSTPHTRHVCVHFRLWDRPFHLSLLTPFFLLFGVAMKGIHSILLHCQISFLLFVRLTTCFLSS